MNILIRCETMSYLSGSPLYHYELAKELAKEHKVYFNTKGEYYKELLEGLTYSGVIVDEVPSDIDLIIASQRSSEMIINRLKKPTIYIVHSEYDYEIPPLQSEYIIGYVAIRKSIKEIIDKMNTGKECRLIYNGVDRERFKQDPNAKIRSKIVVPCTLDPMRQRFIRLLPIEFPEYEIEFWGKDFGAVMPDRNNVSVNPEVFHIENVMQSAEMVAGIHLGRVNIEAWSMGKPSIIHAVDRSEYVIIEPPETFDEDFNIVNVAKKILAFANGKDIDYQINYYKNL